MKRTAIILGAMLALGTALNAYAADQGHQMGNMGHHQMMHTTDDERTSLNMPPQMKQHQLANMRAHLEALQSIIGYLAEDKYDQASETAHNQLGLTPQMQQMCSMFGNDEYRELGFAFHRSGDELGDVLKTKNKKRSLQALQATINYCVQCHATYRQ